MSSEDNIALRIRNISKCFEMYEKPIHRLYQTLFAGRKKFYKEFWALKDINFEIRKGECVGILGRNGAGKSTLLQIITGTLQPTTGTIDRRGRIAALLELGSGFNPEFTGRENVYLNAAILGLSQKEIEACYQDILDFADIGEFINQPVKTYSSGMMVRLAFAVQIMVKPDILLVDEALAVGDAVFQRKCYMRMQEMLKSGMTLIFVSHDTETVKQTCQRVIYLKHSKVEFDGASEDGITYYLHDLFPLEYERLQTAVPESGKAENADLAEYGSYVYEKSDFSTSKNVWGIGGAFIQCVRIYGLETDNFLKTPGKIKIEVHALWDKEFVRRKIAEQRLYPSMMIGIRLSDIKNIPIYGTNNNIEKLDIDPYRNEKAVLSYELELPKLKRGDVFLTVAVAIGTMNHHIHLIWDDLAIHLESISDSLSDGVFYCPTKLSLKVGE